MIYFFILVFRDYFQPDFLYFIRTHTLYALFYTMYTIVNAAVFVLCLIKVWIIVQLAEDVDSSNDIRVLGGIPLLLALLQ